MNYGGTCGGEEGIENAVQGLGHDDQGIRSGSAAAADDGASRHNKAQKQADNSLFHVDVPPYFRKQWI